MFYQRRLRNGIEVRSTGGEHVEQLERLQEIVFPTLADEERFKAAHYRKHIELFPEGQMVALDGERVIGMTTTVLLDLDHAHPARFSDVIQGGWCTAHDPRGRWMYGLDIGTHPDARGKGVGRALYAARHEVVRRLGLKGQATAGMLSGYGARAAEMSVDDYYAAVVRGDIVDPTVSTQMRIGFEPHGLIRDYLDDPVCGGCCAELVLPVDREVGAAWAD